MNTRQRPLRLIICEVCGRHTQTQIKSRDICSSCHRAQPSSLCKRCGLMKKQVSAETGFCLRCSEVSAYPVSSCSRCSQTKAIYNQEDWLCHTCHRTVQYLLRCKAKQNKTECIVCGELRSPTLLGKAICRSCWRKEKYGRKVCARCNKSKQIFKKNEGLCKECDKEIQAPRLLRDYVITFNTPYSYNKFLFDLLVTTVDWNWVTEKINRRFRAFGRFLQTYQLPQPLTWEAIEAASPTLGATNRAVPKNIRMCLLDLGHLLANKGKLESRETYILRRSALLPITAAPKYIQPLLHRYATWLWERQTRPANIRKHLHNLAAFWSWCGLHNIKSLEEVQPSFIDNYLLTLYWQWQCLVCQEVTGFEPNCEAPKICTHCGALHCFNKVKRYAQNTVRGYRAKLLVFFDWARNNRMVIINPVQRRVAAPDPTIRHYSSEVMKPLYEYVASSDAEPTEALVLYLVIFHALSLWELRHVEVPVVLPMRENIPRLRLAEAYYVIVPKPKPSRGNRSPGRPSIRLDFPSAAAAWLKPLLERFEAQRELMIANPSNRYLIVTPKSARRNMPAGHDFVGNIVREASSKVLGAACNPNTLRKTAGVIFADHASGEILRWMGWEDQQAFGYTWMPREVVHPKQLNSSDDTKLRSDLEYIDFPSVTETNPSNTLGSGK